LFERLKAAISTFNHQFGVEGYSEVPDPAPKAAAKPSASPQPSAQKGEGEAAPKPKAAPRKKASK
jgi:hypothetical protein